MSHFFFRQIYGRHGELRRDPGARARARARPPDLFVVDAPGCVEGDVSTTEAAS